MEFQVKLTGNAKLEIEAVYLWLRGCLKSFECIN
jgi:hypothetical protein